MLWAHGVIVLSVTCGTLLALLPRQKDAWIGPARTFALMAALSVVLLHLIPEALEGVGPASLGAFVVGLLAPGLLGRLGSFLYRARFDGKSRSDIALETSYAGLLLHRVGDGLGLGVFAGELHFDSAQGGVITALAAHAVPYVAIVVLTFDSVRGRGSAIGRAVGLALASMLGVVIAERFPVETFETASSWVSALVGGMLLHVVSHDLESQMPVTFSQRTIDFLAGALGVVVSLIGSGHEGEESGIGGRVAASLLHLSIETGPLLILGLSVGALIAAFGHRLPRTIFRRRSAFADATMGAVFGAPLPLCSCSVLPISSALLARGAGAGFATAFLLATPELGVETFWLSFHFLGPRFATFRIVGAVALSIVAAVLLAKATRTPTPTVAEGRAFDPGGFDGAFPRRFLLAFDDLFEHVGAWMVVGLVLAALLDAALPADALASLASIPLQFLVVTLVAVPSYVCAPSATPLAAILVAKGVDPGAALVGLLLGPATNLATFAFLKRSFGLRGAAAGIGGAIVMAWGLGAAYSWFPGAVTVVPDAQVEEHGGLWVALAVVSLVFLLRAVHLTGARRFLSQLGLGHGHHGHAHGGHAHGDHGHGHGASHPPDVEPRPTFSAAVPGALLRPPVAFGVELPREGEDQSP